MDQLLTVNEQWGTATFQIKSGDSVCPPCYEKWFPVEPAAEPEVTEDDYAEDGEDNFAYEGDGKGLGG